MLWKREPALFYGLVNAIIALVVSFGLQLKADQIGAILAVTSAVLALTTRKVVGTQTAVAVAAAATPVITPGVEGP